MSDLRQACPRRPYGGTNTNTALQASVPIIGLGCSGYSTFFNPPDPDGGTSNKLTRDTITKDHPQVQKWISTIRHAIVDCGINLLDTAPWYGHGVSEIVIGFALEDMIESDEVNKMDAKADASASKKVARKDLIISTKVGRYEANPADMFDFSYDRVIESVQTSLDRLKCGGYIDVIQCHDPEFSPSIQLLLDETIPALLEVKSRGWAKSLGITGYPLELQKEILVRSAVREGKSYEPPTFVFDQALTYCHANLHDMSLFIAPPPPSPLVFEPPSAVSLISDADKTWVASNKTTLQRNTSDGSGSISTGEKGASSSTIGTGEKGTSASTFGADNLIGIGEEDEFQEMSFSEFCSSKGIALMAAAPLSMGLLTQAGPPAWHPASDELKEACRNAAYVCREEFDVDFASLAILFALAQQEIPCTLLGMKSVEELDRAMELAQRFAGLDPNLSTEEVLVSILTEEEGEALATVLDDEYGPFAQIWQDGDFSWDGFEEAAKHWDKVEGGRKAAEAKMRVRR